MFTIEIFEKAVKAKGFRLTRVSLLKNHEGKNVVRFGLYDDEEKQVSILWDPIGRAYTKKNELKDKEDYYLTTFYGKEIAFPMRDTYWRKPEYDLYLK